MKNRSHKMYKKNQLVVFEIIPLCTCSKHFFDLVEPYCSCLFFCFFEAKDLKGNGGETENVRWRWRKTNQKQIVKHSKSSFQPRGDSRILVDLFLFQLMTFFLDWSGFVCPFDSHEILSGQSRLYIFPLNNRKARHFAILRNSAWVTFTSIFYARFMEYISI